MKALEELKAAGEAPDWMTEESLKTLNEGYMLEGETPRGMYLRVASAAAKYLPNVAATKDIPMVAGTDIWTPIFFDMMWKNWLCPATPVMTNMGTDRGLPISCYGSYVPDSLDGIFSTVHEVAMMSKYGGGTSGHMDTRASGKKVHGTGGKSSGAVSWAKVLDSTIMSVSQNNRRGATGLYLDILHGDAMPWMRIRRPEGDINRHCPNIHHGVCISDQFMKDMLAGNEEYRLLWKELLKNRVETGEPYIFFSDAAQRDNPPSYALHDLKVNGSNLCTEIMLATNLIYSFVCCLSSLNVARFDEWKDTPTPYYATIFLDCVMEEFIQKAKKLKGMEKAVRFAQDSRALGLGVLGWHTLLQEKMIAFDSFEAMQLNAKIFSKIRKDAEKASEDMINLFHLKTPLLCEGMNRRNSHLLAVAPTVSNSIISGNVSAGIEPIPANAFVKKTAQGAHIQRNLTLSKKLSEIGMDTDEVWTSIVKNEGSVWHLNIPQEVKEVFLTAREINQFAIIKQAGQRQKWIDQGQSVNLFFASNSDPKYIHKVHVAAWEAGLKSLYYFRSSSNIKGDMASRSETECKACEG